MSAKQAFNSVIALAGRDMEFKRKSGPDVIVNVKAAPSSLYRQLTGPEEMTIDATEIVVTFDSLNDSGFGIPDKGHYVTDSVMGVQIINSVKNMFVLGELIGYRIGFK